MATVEIDGKRIEVNDSKMIIEVADEHGITIPRFCYHKHLSVAANCRMCLVEVENSRKPMPACATPISDGMRVFTKSPAAIAAQKSVMEFLLINHPLDCPICDQGGECELQDVALGYGDDVSHYSEGKRAVQSDDLGSLISTEMTRCIHCTRCVRFGEEIAGMRELGATGRGEDMQIGTFVQHSMKSEISGNIIDLCPVGALTSKPFRYRARAWELQQRTTVAAFDCLGSNVHAHTRRGVVMRVLPKENDSINQTWLSDRDRFAYTGLLHEERLATPLIKQNGHWVECDWQTALTAAVNGFSDIIKRHDANALAALTTAQATLEEAYLLQKLMRGLGSNNVDHRCHEIDFADQDVAPLFPGMNIPYQSLAKQQAILLVGSDIQREQPLAAVRLRQAFLQDAAISVVNAYDYDVMFDCTTKIIVDHEQLPQQLAEIAKSLVAAPAHIPAELCELLLKVTPSAAAIEIAKQLQTKQQATVILGAVANNHPHASILRSLARLIGELAEANVVQMTEGPNAAGAWLAGAVPHRGPVGKKLRKAGLDSHAMFKAKLPGYLLLNIEPELDCAYPQQAMAALHAAEFVVIAAPYKTSAMMQYADVILPTTPFTETSGTFINVAGTWQSFMSTVPPYEQARPAWKVLRVLGNLHNLDGFDYTSTTEIHDELRGLNDKYKAEEQAYYIPARLPDITTQVTRLGTWGNYRGDMITRRAQPLQQAASAESLVLRVSPEVAKQYNLRQGKSATIMQEGAEISLDVTIDTKCAPHTIVCINGFSLTSQLPMAFGKVDLK